MRVKRVVCVCVVVLVLGVIYLIARHGRADRSPVVSIQNSGDSVSTDGEVVFVTEYAEEKKMLSTCDGYLSSLFSGGKYDMKVSVELVDVIDTKVASISPEGGCIAKQLSIEHSGLTTLEDGYDYLAIASVHCIDGNSLPYVYDIVICLALDTSGVVVDFKLFSF